MNNFCLYSKQSSPRLTYICNWIFESVFNGKCEIVTDRESFIKSNSIPLNYSNTAIENTLSIENSNLLYEKELNHNINIEKGLQSSLNWIEVQGEKLPDFLSTIFILLSRYEEHLDFKKDNHGRFNSNSSSLNKMGHNNLVPFVDQLIYQLAKYFEQQFPTLFNWEPSYNTHKTLDIDMVFKYKGRFFERNLGAISRDIITLNFGRLLDRTLVLLGKKKDPYYIFDELKDSSELTFFIHCGKYSKYDKQAGLYSQEFLTFLKNHKTDIGLHPSYISNSDIEILKDELEMLEAISGKTIDKSRQHYIKLSFPKTYKDLIHVGIKEDYSMGFVDEIGFRAGTSRSFPYFNLENNVETDLIIHPFCAMDVTLKRYQKLPVSEAESNLKELINSIKKFGGTYRIIFHNESLSEEAEWNGYQTLFALG